MSEWLAGEPESDTFANVVRTMGSYVLEVARREFGSTVCMAHACVPDNTPAVIRRLRPYRGRSTFGQVGQTRRFPWYNP